MKLTAVCVSLSILLVAFPALGEPDLTGTWCVSMSTAYSQGDPNPPNSPGFFEEEYEIEILEQENNALYGVLFHGQVDVGTEFTFFSGVLDGDDISMTHWDSVTRGKLKEKKNKPHEISFINNAFDADYRSGKTAVGIAVKGNCPLP